MDFLGALARHFIAANHGRIDQNGLGAVLIDDVVLRITDFGDLNQLIAGRATHRL